MRRKLSTEQLEELQSGDGYYYVTQGLAGSVGDWPAVMKHPKNKKLRLVRRQVPKEEYRHPCILCGAAPSVSKGKP